MGSPRLPPRHWIDGINGTDIAVAILEMAPSLISNVLAHTARHEVNAWITTCILGALLSFIPTVFGSASHSERLRLSAILMASLFGAAVFATVLPIFLRLPHAIAARSLTPLLVGDKMAIGALLGFGLSAALGARHFKLPLSQTLDKLTPSLGIIVLFGRIGCFLEGCDFGRLHNGLHAVTYPNGSHTFHAQVASGLIEKTASSALPVYPVQLYEAAVGALILGLAVCAPHFPSAKVRTPGLVFRLALLLYATLRFAIETLRGDLRPTLGHLSLPQWLCVGIAMGLIGTWPQRRAAPPHKISC